MKKIYLKYFPSYLLCNEVLNWHPIEKCLPILDKTKYSRFEEENSGKEDEDGKNLRDSEVMILHKRKVMTLCEYIKLVSSEGNQVSERDKAKLREFAGLVGRKCAAQFLVYRS